LNRKGQRRVTHKTVASPRNGFDISGAICRVPEHVPDFFDGCVQAVVEIDERVRRPKRLFQIFAGDDLPAPLQ